MTEPAQGLRQTLSNTAIYGVSIGLRRLTSIIMLPIYTRYLTPADYGSFEMLYLGVSVLNIVLGVRIAQTLPRFYTLAESELEKGQIAFTTLICLAVVTAVGAVFLQYAASPVSLILFGNYDYILEIRVFAASIFTTALMEIGFVFLRAQQRPVLFLILNVLSLVLQVLANVVFIVFMDLHLLGMVIASVVSSGAIAVALVLYLIASSKVSFSLTVAKSLYAFVTPLVVSSVAGFLIYWGDRYLLRVLDDVAAVGIYAVAFRLASAAHESVVHPFNMAWSVDRYALVKQPNARELYGRMFKLFCLFICVAAATVSILAEPILRIFATAPFMPAADVVPFLALTYIFIALANYCNFGSLYAKKTKHVAEATWIGAAVAIGAYSLLIPSFGFIGAGIGTCLGRGASLIWVHAKSKQYYDMRLSWRPIWLLVPLSVPFIWIARLPQVTDFAPILGPCVLVFVYVALVYVLPLWSADDRAQLQRFASIPLGMIRRRQVRGA